MENKDGLSIQFFQTRPLLLLLLLVVVVVVLVVLGGQLLLTYTSSFI